MGYLFEALWFILYTADNFIRKCWNFFTTKVQNLVKNEKRVFLSYRAISKYLFILRFVRQLLLFSRLICFVLSLVIAFFFSFLCIHSSLHHRQNPPGQRNRILSGQQRRPRREQEERTTESVLLAHQEVAVAVHASQADAHPQEDPHPQAAPVARALPHPQEDG